MFETVKEDIRVATPWHPLPIARRLWGERGAQTAAVLLSTSLQVVLIYRFQVWLRGQRIPILPGLCRRLTMAMAAVSIGDTTRIDPGLLLAHGNVVIDGRTWIGPLCTIGPFVTIGLDTGGPDASVMGPQIGRYVFIGTGAKILGPVRVGHNARIGANAVVLIDVPDDSTAVGVPARIIPHEGTLGPAQRPDPGA